MAGDNTNSTLVFGVRTDAAVQQVRTLAKELQALKAQLPTLAATVATTSRTVEGSVTTTTKTTSRAVKQAVQDLETSVPKIRASYSQTMNGVKVSMSQMVDATDKGFTDITRKVEEFAKDPSLARAIDQRNQTNMAKQAIYMDQETRRVREAERLRTRELKLEDAYYAKSEAQRIRHLERLQRLQSRGRTNEYLTAKYGATVVADIPRLSELREAEESQRRVNRSMNQGSDNALRHRDALRANSLAMRDAHSAARGLAGSLNMLWLTWGQVAAISAGAALGGMARGTYQVGKDLEYRLRFVEALGNNPVSIDNLMPSVLGSMKTPLEAAEGLQALAQAGLDTNQSLRALSGTMQLSTLGEMSMADAAFAVTGALSAFNLEASESSRVGDVFAKAAAMSNTSVSGIVQSMRQASTAAADYNISIEEVSGALAIMAQRNITGSMAGTSYRNMLKELYTPIARGAKAMDALGISAYDSENRMKPLTQILEELQRKLVGLDQSSRNKALEAIFGERGARAIRPILSDLKEYIRTVETMGESQGFLAEASAKLVDSVEGAQNRMQSTMQQSFATAFTEVEPQIRNTLQALDEMFASEGFVGSVTTIATAVARLTTLFADHAGKLSILGAAYVTLRLTQAGIVSASRAASGAKEIFTGALFRNTTAANANSVAMRANAAANATATGAMATSAGASMTLAGRLGGVVARVSSVTGVVGVAIGLFMTLTAIVGALRDSFFGAEAGMQSFEESLSSHLGRVEAQMNAMKNAAEVQETSTPMGLKQRSEAQQASLTKNRRLLEENERKLAVLDAAIGAESVEKLNAYESIGVRQGAMGLAEYIGDTLADAVGATKTGRQALIDERKRLAGEVAELREAVTLGEQNLSKMEELRKQAEAHDARATLSSQRSEIVNRTEALITELDYADGKLKDYLEKANLPGLLEKANAAKDLGTLKQLQGQLKEVVDGANKLRTSVSFEDPNKGGSLIFRSSVSNLMQQFRNQDQLLTARRDLELKAIKDLRDVGGYSADEAAKMRSGVWDRYIQQTLSNAKETEQKIRAINKGSPELKELSVEKLMEDAEQARRQSIAQQENDDFQRRVEDQISARKLIIKTAKDQEKAELGLAEKVRESALAYERAYMTQAQIISSEGAELASDAFRKLIDERKASLVALEQSHGPIEAKNLKEYQDTLDLIDALEKELGVRKQITAEQLLAQYNENNTVESGFRRGMRTYQNEISKVGDQAAESIGNSFKALEDGITQVFKNGKFEASSFFDTLGNEMARFLARNAMRSMFGESAGGSGSGLLGGLVQAGIGLLGNSSLGSFSNNMKGLSTAGPNAAGGVTFDTGPLAGTGAWHTGGIVGGRAPTSRTAPASIFSGAPRFHGGGVIGAGEVPIIAQRGEGVFTPEQMAALAPAGGSPTIVVNQTVNVDARADRASIIQGMQIAKADTINTIAEQFSRDGMMRRVAH